ncbi:MAG TPA: hypothetical protein VKZ18_16565, partial [Polyangia bacterium]|nr:hypothetical protein [Polyangia bacterium]
MNTNRAGRLAVIGLASLLFVACAGTGAGGQGGATGAAGATGSGGTTTTGGAPGTGGTTGKGGATGSGGTLGTGGARDGGTDTSIALCWAESDCTGSQETCLVPDAGVDICTGPCVPVKQCASDSDCTPDAAVPIICGFGGCGCTTNNMACRPGCLSDADCYW